MVAIKTLLFIIFVSGLVMYVIPVFLARLPFPLDFGLGIFRLAGFIPVFAGFLLYLWCAWDFTFSGKGTPAPIAPPKKLVIKGAYRFVRNPMYIGIIMVLLGEAMVFESFVLLLYALAVFSVVFLFVIYYEEPVLRKEFARSYTDYCYDVPRWIPKLCSKDK